MIENQLTNSEQIKNSKEIEAELHKPEEEIDVAYLSKLLKNEPGMVIERKAQMWEALKVRIGV